MTKRLWSLIIVLIGSVLYAQQGVYTTKGKFMNSECASQFCYLSFQTHQGEEIFCAKTGKQYPNISVNKNYMISWKEVMLNVENMPPVKCNQIVKVKPIR
jgi:hypothetical protein